jgi:hypothetical protein
MPARVPASWAAYHSTTPDDVDIKAWETGDGTFALFAPGNSDAWLRTDRPAFTRQHT